jgi:hypothetical protein
LSGIEYSNPKKCTDRRSVQFRSLQQIPTYTHDERRKVAN